MVYTNLAATNAGKHGMFESSRLKATVVGHIYDALVVDGSDEEIAVDNGAPVLIGAHTGKGLQEVKATIATTKDKIAVVGSPAVVKDAFTTAQGQPYNYFVPAGADAKAYEVVEEDIFAVADYQITSGTVAVGAYVVVDGTGAYKVVGSDPSATNGFVGRVHSIVTGTYYTMVRIETVQNKTIA